MPRPSINVEILTAEDAAKLIRDGDTVGLTGAGGGLLEADVVNAAIEARFLATGSPNRLTAIHALGFGDRKERGQNRFAHEGMVKRLIAGNWAMSPAMQALAAAEKIEAYSLPAGAISNLFREIGAGRPGFITNVGIGTFVDPRDGGGSFNRSAKDRLVELIEIGGKEYLRYLPFPIDIAIVRGTYADAHGNISLEEEPVDLDTYYLALAARNSAGRVIAQVREVVPAGSLLPRNVTVPAALVDAVVIAPGQTQTYRSPNYEPSIAGVRRALRPNLSTDGTPALKRVIANRALREIRPGDVLNFGYGTATSIATLISERDEVEKYRITIEQGIHGGHIMDGDFFGITINPVAIRSMNEQFDFYSGGGLDLALMGMAELDSSGNVNVSHLGGKANGPGGFIDIVQNARRIVYCGHFEGGAQIKVEDGRLALLEAGTYPKIVKRVEAVTFNGDYARSKGQEVIYVTERAVFRLAHDGVELIEFAPGIDLDADILGRMQFRPIVRNPKTMDPSLFKTS